MFISGFVSVFDCSQSVHLVSRTGRADDSLYSLRSVNSLHIVKIAAWRSWFFSHKGFPRKNLCLVFDLDLHYLLTSGI
jgi:hypothetical protein